ncbi:MAG: hypothetical protein HND53_11995 [Proteobacteria bacterium]|nr:hypothetical protein [Pseudomonadota bacterium]NOG61215.1 hypothetical protein [Pseudomonadota bacterium]
MSDIKQVESLYQHSYISFIATLFAAILVYWLFKSVADINVLTTWLIVFVIITVIRIFISWRFLNIEHKNSDLWLIAFLVMSMISGTLWGLTGILFIEKGTLPLLDSVLYHGMLLLFIAALITGSIVTYSASKIVYLSFSVPAVVPQCLLLISEGDKYHSLLGGIVLIYACVMFVFSVYIHKIFAENIKIEARNELLGFALKKNGIKLD